MELVKDELYYNVTTGECLPALDAIRAYYAEPGRGPLDAWTDEWAPTGAEADAYIAPPDWGAGLVNI